MSLKSKLTPQNCQATVDGQNPIPSWWVVYSIESIGLGFHPAGFVHSLSSSGGHSSTVSRVLGVKGDYGGLGILRAGRTANTQPQIRKSCTYSTDRNTPVEPKKRKGQNSGHNLPRVFGLHPGITPLGKLPRIGENNTVLSGNVPTWGSRAAIQKPLDLGLCMLYPPTTDMEV